MMIYKNPIAGLIKRRYSCRTFLKEKLGIPQKKALQKACSLHHHGLLGEDAKFQLVELRAPELIALNPDDFSSITNPLTFIVGTIQPSRLAYESYGYLLEYLVLNAEDLGLGTCWLGYFNKFFFRNVITSGYELMPAVCVLGYPAEERHSSSRNEWREMFFVEKFGLPLSRESAGKYGDSFDMLRLAPSSGNTQPWRVVKERNRDIFHFYKETIDFQYEQRKLHNVDLGIGMCHFELAARKNDLEGTWVRFTNITVLRGNTDYLISWIDSDTDIIAA